MTDFAPMRLRTHPKVLFGPALITLIGLAVMVGLAMLIPTFTDIAWAIPAALGTVLLFLLITAGVPWLRWWCGSFHIDAEKITVRVGVLNRKTTEIPVRRLTQVSCEQDLLDRMWRCGTLILADASAMQGGARFDDIPNVKYVQDQLNTLIYERQEAAAV